jgi:hypothetical protein
MDKVECKELIVSTLGRRGDGTRHSPVRVITEIFEKDGTKIAEYDPSPETFAQMDLIYFARWVKKMGYDPENIGGKMVFEWLESIENNG